MHTDGIFELLKNEDFVLWVVNPREESDHYWTKWMAMNPSRRSDLERAREIIQAAKTSRMKEMDDSDYDQMLQHIVSHQNRNKYGRRKTDYLPYLSVAASILVLFVLSFFLWQYHATTTPQPTEIVYVHKQVPLGSKLKTKLPDGSMVTLNAGSHIYFPTEFGAGEREVRLVGEAFFEVTRDEQRPFLVKTEEMTVQVLGTSFSVDAEGNMNAVAVRSGKVAVFGGDRKSSVVLNPMQRSMMSEDGELVVGNIDNEDLVFGWLDQMLIFEEEQLSNVVNEIEKWFGVSIHLENINESTLVYTAKYKNPSLKEVLESLSHVYDFKFQIYDRKKVVLKN